MAHKTKDNLIEEICEMLIENGFDGMAKVMEMLMNAAMQLERSQSLNAEPYERSPERKGYANGFKDRKFQTRMGELNLKIPQTRAFRFTLLH